MDFIQSGEPPEALGGGDKVIRTLPRPYPHKLLTKVGRNSAVLYVLIACVTVPFILIAQLITPGGGTLAVGVSFGFLAGMLAFQLRNIRIVRFSRSRVTDQLSTYEFRADSVIASRSDGTSSRILMRHLHSVLLMGDEAVVCFDPFRVWGLTPTDLEDAADWPQLVDWWIECGALKPKLRDKALALSNKPPR